MTALIACSHGTNDEAGRDAIRALVDQVRSGLPDIQVEQAFVDVEEPELPTVLDATTAAASAVVVPLLLSTGYHTKVDIARAVNANDRACAASPLGTHPLVAEVVTDRVREAIPGGFLSGDHLVLAAAGSSNPAAIDDVRIVADRIAAGVITQEKCPHRVRQGHSAHATN
ncbi:CbiX protein [Micrococcales bacterium KH10]|nr:CbiX protein [Micrococcales bacterium KH10]